MRVSVNEIKFVRKSELPPFENVFVVLLNGEEINSLDVYFDKMSELLMFPIKAKSWAGYNDWITDLSWIDSKNFAVVIKNYDCFLCDDLSAKKVCFEHFRDDVLPWWQEDVKKYVVDGEPKNFNVYLC